MISVNKKQNCDFKIVYVYEKPKDSIDDNIPAGIQKIFDKGYKSCFPYVSRINILDNDEKLEDNDISSDNTKQSRNNVSKDNVTLYVGLGEASSFKLTKIKDIVAYSIKQVKKYKVKNIAVDLSLFLREYGTSCIVEVVLGIKLGLYSFKGYSSIKEEKDYVVFFEGYSEKEEDMINKEICLALNLAEGVILARDLVNTPANKLNPITMADNIRKLGEHAGFQVEVFDEKYIVEIGMDAFYTVGRSSGNPPRLIIARYLGDDESDNITALVGKGVTCDTGGYCLKPSNSMAGIKGDMAGSASVIGAIYALAKNKVRTNVVGVIPACENRISRESFIPGDVINSLSGKSIEILNTDAEGRLILADAVTYAIQKEKAKRVIDIATLTGAVVNALGFSTAGLLSNDREFYQEFKKGYKKSGEQYWQFPIYDEYRDMIKSDIADVKNVGKNYCGTITAGLFIEKFVEDKPWIHLDIAGTAWVETPIYEYQAAGATGAGVTSMYYLFAEKE